MSYLFLDFQSIPSHPGGSPLALECLAFTRCAYRSLMVFLLVLLGTFLKTNRELGEFIMCDKPVSS